MQNMLQTNPDPSINKQINVFKHEENNMQWNFIHMQVQLSITLAFTPSGTILLSDLYLR